MEYRIVPSTGDRISILGYGGMRFPTVGSRIDEAKALTQLKRAIDGGLNYIDTAYFYHGGQSEVLIGKLMQQGYHDRVKIATKLPPWLVSTKEDMSVIFNEQLNRLKVECIDYYLLHALNRESWQKFMQLDVLDFLDDLKKRGLIKHVGFSFHGDREVFKEIIDAYPWDVCQIQYNILDEYNQAGREGLLYAASKNIAVFIMEPLRGGTLATKLPEEARNLYEAVEPSWTPVEWALRWLWSQKEVTMVLSGMTEDQHLDDNMKYAQTAEAVKLTSEHLSTVAEVKKTYLSLQKVPCTGCQYCLPCPFGVDIPRCFDLYNSKYLLNQKVGTFYWMQMGGMNGAPSYASLCKRCGKCLEHCPQSIDIPNRLAEVAKDMEHPLMRPTIKLAAGSIKIYTAVKRRFKGANKK